MYTHSTVPKGLSLIFVKYVLGKSISNSLSLITFDLNNGEKETKE